MSAALPPLPEMGYLGDDASYGYDAFDMKAYAQQARADLEAENIQLRMSLEWIVGYIQASPAELVWAKEWLQIARSALKEQP